jgi:hypothetical protein
MVYVLRLANGDCIITSARDDREAREIARQIGREPGDEIVSTRRLPQFCVRLSPAESGSLDINSWEDATLDNLLANEYPVLNEALHTANRVKFMAAPESGRPLIAQLREAYEKNTEIIREGIREEQQRLMPAQPVAAEPVRVRKMTTS